MSAAELDGAEEVDSDAFDLRPPAESANGAAALCLHGLTGTPYEVRPVAEALVARGVRARGPWMAGHEEGVEALAKTSWQAWVEGATEDEIVAVAKAAHADHFIRTLPDGYDTVLNEEASNISQGQKQLLTIARAFLANPSILILDEATSSVDTRTELIIQKAMGALMKGRTNFIIAHRLSTIRDADIILVMNEGAIIEQGTHQGLLAANGFYADLYNSQFVGDDAV